MCTEIPWTVEYYMFSTRSRYLNSHDLLYVCAQWFHDLVFAYTFLYYVVQLVLFVYYLKSEGSERKFL